MVMMMVCVCMQDVLVTGPVVGLRKVTRLVKLAREAPRVGVCVDDEKNAQLIAEVGGTRGGGELGMDGGREGGFS